MVENFTCSQAFFFWGKEREIQSLTDKDSQNITPLSSIATGKLSSLSKGNWFQNPIDTQVPRCLIFSSSWHSIYSLTYMYPSVYVNKPVHQEWWFMPVITALGGAEAGVVPWVWGLDYKRGSRTSRTTKQDPVSNKSISQNCHKYFLKTCHWKQCQCGIVTTHCLGIDGDKLYTYMFRKAQFPSQIFLMVRCWNLWMGNLWHRVLRRCSPMWKV